LRTRESLERPITQGRDARDLNGAERGTQKASP
jgi:hypothetical protein